MYRPKAALRPLAGVSWFLSRRALRQGWRSAVAIAILLGVLGGCSLALAVGARRTATAYDRAVRATSADDLSFYPTYSVGTPLTLEKVAAVDGVVAVDLLDSTCADFSQFRGGGAREESIAVSRKNLEGRTMNKLLRLRSRPLDSASATDVIVEDRFAHRLGLTVGSVLSVAVGGCGGGVATKVRLRIIGIGRSLDEPGQSGLGIVVGAGVVPHPAVAYPVYKVRLRSGVDPSRTIALIQAIAPDNPITSVLRSDRRRSASAEPFAIAVGLAAAASALGLAVAVTVLFVSTRAVRARRASTNEALSGLGLSPRSITIASAAPILPWFLVGSIVVCLTAYSLSPRFPIGSARRFEPLLGPGAHIGAIVSVLLITAVLFLAGSVFGGIRDARANSRIPSRNIRFRLVGPAFLCLGSRFARGRARAALGSGVVAALAVAALGVGASAHGLVGAPSLTGSPEDATINESIDDVIDFGDANKLERAELADLRRLEISNALRAVAFKRRADTIVNGLTAPLWGVSDRKGHVPFPIISGRAIHHDGEIALGVALARRLHVRLGDVVNVGERSKRFRVVGLVAATGDMNDAERDGNRTALVSFEDYRRLYPAPNQTSALVRFAPSVPRSRWLATVRQIVPRRRSISVELSLPTRPPKVLALEHLRAPLALGAGALAATAFVGLAQSLSAAVRRRRGALATLSSLGATPRMLSLSVIAESCIVGCLTLVGGTTAGVVIGRRAWHALVDSMGFTTQHVLPVRPIVVGALTFGVMIIVHAALVSQTPSRFRERFAVT